jgi:anti-anti-sigma factor
MDRSARATQVTVNAVARSDVLVVQLSGALDAASAAVAEVSLQDVTDPLPPPARIVLDLTDVSLLSAAGTRLLQRIIGVCVDRDVAACLVTDSRSAVHSVVTLTLQDQRIRLFDSLDDALGTG